LVFGYSDIFAIYNLGPMFKLVMDNVQVS